MNPFTKAILISVAALPSVHAATLILGDTSGDDRGANAIDIQTLRYQPSRVASGARSVAIGISSATLGNDSTTVGLYSETAGYYNVNFGASNYIYSTTTESAAVGLGNDITGAGGLAFGYCNVIFDNYDYTDPIDYSNWYQNSVFASAFGSFNSIESVATRSYVFGRGNTATATNTGIFGADITNGTAGSTMIGPSNTAKVTILSSGNVGIGTEAPSSKLHVVGDLNVTGTIINPMLNTSGSGSTSRLRVGGTAPVNLSSSWQGTAIIGADGQNKIVTGYLASSTNGAVLGAHNSALSAWADLNVTGTNLIFRSGGEAERMRINSSGNVGLGTTSPTTKLHIASTGSTRGLRIQSTGTTATDFAEAQFAANAREFRIGTGGSGVTNGLANKFYLWDVQAGTPRVVVDTAGNVGIGTTSPSSPLHIVSAASGSVKIQNPSSTGYASLELFDSANVSAASLGFANPAASSLPNSLMVGTRNTTSSVHVIAGASTPTPRFTVTAAGNVGISTTTPAAKLDVAGNMHISGDIRVKNRAVLRVSPAGDIGMGDFDSGLNPETGVVQ